VILFAKFLDLGEALDDTCKSGYARLADPERRYIKGQKYILLSHRENLSLDDNKALTTPLTSTPRTR